MQKTIIKRAAKWLLQAVAAKLVADVITKRLKKKA